MAVPGQNSSLGDSETEITLGVLNAVEENSRITQRTVAKDLGIALGLVNAYVKRCIKKGLIKVNQAPANRYAYYLTPKGFAEKSRLTREYLAISFNFFREARRQCVEIFDNCATHGWTRVAFAGNSDLVEIAMLCVAETGIDIVGIVDPDVDEDMVAGLPVFARLKDAGTVDALLITDLDSPQETFDKLVREIPMNRVLAPKFANITRRQPPKSD